jgi:tetratricopeptide (TPR) repeat protein
MERMHGALGQECSDALAVHFEEAGEYKKAIGYRMEAAQRYQDTGSWFEAAAHYASAQRLLRENPGIGEAREKLLRIWEGIWICSRVFNPMQAIEALETLAALHRTEGRKKEEIYACIRLINLYSQKAMFDKALQLFDYATLRVPDDPVLCAAAKTAVAYTYTFLGKPLYALSLLDEARTVLDASDRFVVAVNALTTLAARVWIGDMHEARAWYHKAKASCRAYMDLDLMTEVWLAHICCLEGGFIEARKVYQEVSRSEKKLGKMAGGLTYLRIQGSIYFRSRYLGDGAGARLDLKMFHAPGTELLQFKALERLYQAWINLEEGKVSLARDLIEEVMPELIKGIANRVPYALNTLAEAYLLMGDVAQARKTACSCIEWNEAKGNQDQLIWALRIWAQASIVADDTDAARTALRRAIRLARKNHMKPHVAWNLAVWAELLVRSGKVTRACACYRKALWLWEGMGNPHQADKIRTVLHRLEE